MTPPATPGRPGPAGRPGGAISRRQLFAGTGALGTGLVGASLVGGSAAAAPAGAGGGTVPFTGAHQAGIATPPPAHLVFAVYDVTAGRSGLGALLAGWTAAAARLTAGRALTTAEVPAVTPKVPPPKTPTAASPPATLTTSGAQTPPPDTGEATGLPAANLTLTVGFGPSLFDGRFGLADRRPVALAELPAMAGDALEPQRSGGDLCIQACADDAQVAFHAVHNLTRLASGSAALRYYQVGFAAPGVGPPGAAGQPSTPRNLAGFHDGTANSSVLTPAGLGQFVWVGDDTDQPWLHGGTYLVARRIRIYLEAWSRASLAVQEGAIGRFKASGAPLTGTHQYDAVRLDAVGPDGQAVIPPGAHVRQAAAATNGGQQLLRRSFNYADGLDPATGELDAGLFFICFQRHPARQFVQIQQRLAAADTLTNTYLLHTGSGIFACPPGVRSGQSWGSGLGLGEGSGTGGY